MKTRAVIAAELRQALRSVEMTAAFLEVVRSGSITKAALVQFLEDALAVALDQTFLDLAERIGGVNGIRQLAAAERAVLFSEMADGSLALVQRVADRATESWSDAKLSRELKRAVLLNEKDAKAADNYDQELKDADPKARRRKLRDRRFQAKGKISPAKRKMMVDRYRERLSAHRTASIARDQARAAAAAVEYEHWAERLADGDPEARERRKFWVNMRDGKVRDSHVYVEQDYPDGLPLDEPFVTRWGIMRYPHDSQGHPKDRHGCRCRFRIGRAKT